MQKISKTNLILGIILAIVIVVAGFFAYKFLKLKKENVVLEPEPQVPAVVVPEQIVPVVETKPVVPAKPVDPYAAMKASLLKFTDENTTRFVIGINDTNESISQNLTTQLFTKTNVTFSSTTKIIPGAYRLSAEMTEAQIKYVLTQKPYMAWVVIKPGLRKEEIAELLQAGLGWDKKTKDNFIKVDTGTSAKPEYQEGVYYPDTYLIPVTETGTQVAARLITKFNENFAGYLPQFTAKNIKWTTALTFASVVQREAANNTDASLIAGILWNRLNQNMQLGVDATLQYARGNTGAGWWAPISVADKKIDSPYNTYMHIGLPPRPIANPGVAAINAVLNPVQTDCLYYLHDKQRVTHCGVTYEEHQANIQKYLVE